MREMERRARRERRLHDLGPPPEAGERRRCAERRMPEVREISISEQEWRSLFGFATLDQPIGLRGFTR
mgnify:CR=1 FL=1